METTQDMLKALQSTEFYTRRQAAAKLKKYGDAQAVPTLIKALLQDDDEWVVIVAEALGNIGNKQAVPALLSTLKSEERLAKWKSKWDSLPTIIDEKKRSNEQNFLWETLVAEISDIRVAAANTLGIIGDEGALDGLQEALQDRNDQNLHNAAKHALQQIGTPKALSILTSASK